VFEDGFAYICIFRRIGVSEEHGGRPDLASAKEGGGRGLDTRWLARRDRRVDILVDENMEFTFLGFNSLDALANTILVRDVHDDAEIGAHYDTCHHNIHATHGISVSSFLSSLDLV
jgi:hypothetical protein